MERPEAARGFRVRRQVRRRRGRRDRGREAQDLWAAVSPGGDALGAREGDAVALFVYRRRGDRVVEHAKRFGRTARDRPTKGWPGRARDLRAVRWGRLRGRGDARAQGDRRPAALLLRR